MKFTKYLLSLFRLLSSGSDDFNIIIWDIKRRRPQVTIQSGHEGNIFAVKVIHFCFGIDLKILKYVELVGTVTNVYIITCHNGK